jgi:hypothetical protein
MGGKTNANARENNAPTSRRSHHGIKRLNKTTARQKIPEMRFAFRIVWVGYGGAG